MKEVNSPHIEGPVCPLPLSHDDFIVMGHGSGGRMSHDLIKRTFQTRFDYPALSSGNDFAGVNLPEAAGMKGRLAISTDNHIVTPLIFPGGDIGRIAVCGTVNDISMSGGKPLYLTAGFIMEEGLPFETLECIIDSMKESADEAGIQIIAGDTKVAEKGSVDQLFINTAGIAWIPDDIQIGGQFARPGDAVLISGYVGDHGMAILAARGELGFDTDIESDVAPLNHLIQAILEAAPNTHVLRDPTRGGLATTLNEIATQSNAGIMIEESCVPVRQPVRAACEMLGFDPLYIANEGKLIVIVPENEADDALSAMKATRYGEMATRIGFVQSESPNRVLLKTALGGTRRLDMLAGEILPRIC